MNPASSDHERRAVRLKKTYTPTCDGNLPDSPDSLGTLCPAAIDLCAATPENDLAFWEYTAPVGSNDWRATGRTVCRGPGEDVDPVVQPVEPVVTVTDFRRLPLPPARIKVQPPNRRTLINVPTNLYTQATAVTLPTTILGQPIKVRATPQRFTWTYGDGATRTTSDPGAPYPQLRTAHTYRTPGKARLTLTTTYSGEYAVAGGPWQPIDGTAAVTGPSTALTVTAATNRLVAEPLT